MNSNSENQKTTALWLKITVYLLDIFFFIALIVLPLTWLSDPEDFAIEMIDFKVSWGPKPLWAPLLFALLRTAVLFYARSSFKGLLGFSVAKKVTMSLVMLFLFVGIPEYTLKLMGFELDLAPVVFSLANEDGEVEISKGFDDPELRWKFRKGEKYNGRRINSLGYRDREVDPEKAPGAMRVICLGDSVTAQGNPGYSEYLHRYLNERPPTTNDWEAFNMAVYGYSSMQGLRVFQLEARHLEPDIVTIYFGWNDHWLEWQTDRSRMTVKTGRTVSYFYNLLKNKRVFMLLVKLIDQPYATGARREQPGFRVPPAEYVAVLNELISDIRKAGAVPLLITAANREITFQNQFPDITKNMDYQEIHHQYVELTRHVVSDQNVELLDLHQQFAGEEYDSYFSGDGIHFTQDGLEAIAQALYNKILNMTQREGRMR